MTRVTALVHQGLRRLMLVANLQQLLVASVGLSKVAAETTLSLLHL
jgi:hypothetical protein